MAGEPVMMAVTKLHGAPEQAPGGQDVMGLEERFDISVPEEDLEDVATVGQAVDLVLAKVAAKA